MSKDDAIGFLVNNTGISVPMATMEVKHSARIPGRAPSYKFGELWLKQLRELAEETLGTVFIMAFGLIFQSFNSIDLFFVRLIRNQSESTRLEWCGGSVVNASAS